MSSQSALTSDDKVKVKSSIAISSNKIYTAALARIYFAHPDRNSWSYGGLQGAVVLAQDNTKNALFLRMVDLVGTRGVIWEHELYDGFEYFQEGPFFHSFAGDQCMIGLVFVDESEAKKFFKKVTNTLKKDVEAKTVKSGSTDKKSSNKPGSNIDKSRISRPTEGSFVHVAHMGYDAEKGFISSGVDPSLTTFLTDLQSHGVSQDLIAENMDFIKEFVRDAQKQKAALPPVPAPKNKKPPTRRAKAECGRAWTTRFHFERTCTRYSSSPSPSSGCFDTTTFESPSSVALYASAYSFTATTSSNSSSECAAAASASPTGCPTTCALSVFQTSYTTYTTSCIDTRYKVDGNYALGKVIS
ncbi:hypothetical protein EW146_g344 [Bondarzewia mesenterica]|uniref:WH1 domain-containing protein n=1 Tax=Bondarzewia mesenterica TaxID=1095465 RepID=A0A4S4M7J1_9AGAM|nr:hypothetical protein EW146_g344 [Bondarzewia mesenterica]